jgi:filamentous hemagglutinin family protein
VSLLSLSSPGRALPLGPQTVYGNVSVRATQPGTLLVTQGTSKAIVNWNSFSVNLGELVRIDQPSSSAVLLNRVIGADPSTILGQIQANGRVFLINPRGILFGQGSQVDAGSFVASTLGISNADFLGGRYSLTAGAAPPGSLVANGRISAAGGTVALVSPDLSVGGTVDAARIGLASAGHVLVDVEGDGLVFFDVASQGLNARLNMLGRLQAQGGGTVDVRAQARAGFADTVLNLSGIVQAQSLGLRNGQIMIDGGTAGTTRVSGVVDASGASAGEHGGSVQVLGSHIKLVDQAMVDVSGDSGGGTALIGGNFRGQGPEHNALTTTVGAGVRIDADAVGSGQGGQVAVWSDGRTDFAGTLTARGGAQGGNGGAVETSGKQLLNIPSGTVDISAAAGRGGSWLLDPNNVTISTGADANHDPDPNFTSTDDDAVVNVNTLKAALTNGANVSVTTASAGADTQAGDINVIAGITTNLGAGQTATLNLVAQRGINFSGAGSIAAGGANRTLNVNLNAGTDVGLTNTPGTNVSSITMDAGTSVNTGAGALTATAKGAIALSALTVGAGGLTVNSGGGAITQVGALTVAGTSTVNAGSGAITLTQGTNDFQGAVNLTGGVTQITDANALTLGSLSTGNLTANATGALNLGQGTVTGTLGAVSGNGNITQNGAMTVTGASTVNAGTGAITLTQAANDFQGAVNMTGGATQITDANALTLGTLSTGNLTANSTGALNLGQGTVTGTLGAVSGNGNITQNGAMTVTGASTVNAGTGAITLTQAANDFQGAVNLTGGATQITDANALTLGSLSTGNLTANATGALNLGQGTVTGTLGAASGNGDVTQSGGLTVTGASTVNAGTGAIALTQAANDFQGAVSLTGGAVQVQDTNNLTIASLSSGANSAVSLVSGGTLDLTALAGIDTGSANLTLASNGGTLTTPGALAGNNIALTGSAGVSLTQDVTAAGTLGLSSTNTAINQTAGTVSATGITTVNAGSGAVTLTQPTNDFQGAVSLTGGVTLITDANSLTLGTLNTGNLTANATGVLSLGQGTVTGTLAANSGNGDITQSGALTVTGASTVNAGSGAITLTQAANDFQGAVSLTGGAVQVQDTNNLTIASLSSGANSAVSLVSGGTLDLSALAGIDTGSADLTLASNGGTLTTPGALAGNNIALTGSAGVSLTQDVTAAGTLGLSSTNTAINQTAGTVSATGITTVNAGTGAITLTQAANDFQGAVNLTGGATQITGANALTLGSLSTGNLTANANGALNLGQGTVTGTLVATSGNGDITQSGALTVTGASTVNAGTGAITLTQGANDFLGAVNLTGGVTQITDANALTLGTLSTGNLTANATGALNLGQGTVTGTLGAASGNGDVTQSGGLTVTGITTVNAGTGAVTLTQATNDFQGAVSLTGGVSQITDANALTLGSLSTGNLTANATGALNLGQGTVTGTLGAASGNGDITQSGGLTITGSSTVNAGTGAVTLTQATNDFQGAVNLTGGATQVTDANALTLGTLSTSNLTANSTGTLNLGQGTVAGTLVATSGNGDITQSGALTVTGASTVNAGTGAVTLTQGANDFQGAVNLTGGVTQITDANALTLGTLSTGNLTANSTGALNLGQGTVTGTLGAASGNGDVTQSGGLTVTGTSTVNAGTGAVTLTQATNDFQGAVSVTGGAAQLTDANALTVGGTASSLTAVSGSTLTFSTGNYATLAGTAGGNITQTGTLTVPGTATLTANRNPISIALDQPANNFGSIQLAAAGGGSVATASLADADDLTVGGAAGTLNATAAGALTLGAGTYATLNATAATGIAQTAAVQVSGTATLTGVAGMAVDLSTQGGANALNTVVLATNGGGSLGTVRVNDADVPANGLRIGGNAADLGVTATGAVTLTGGSYGALAVDTSASNASIGQTGALAVSGATTLNIGSGDATLALPTNDLATLAVVNARNVTVADANNLVVANSQVSGKLDLNAPGTVSFSGDLAGTGRLIADGSGTVLINSALSYSGGTAVNSGTLAVEGASAQAGSAAVLLGSAGTLDIRQGGAITNAVTSQGGVIANSGGTGALSGPLSLQAGTTVNVADGAGGLTLDGAVADGGVGAGLAKTGGGVLTLAGSSTYGGATLVNAGSVVAAAPSALSGRSAFTVASDATLNLASSETIGSLAGAGQVNLAGNTLAVGADNSSTVFSGVVDGSGGVTKQGAGSWTLSGSNGYTGRTQVNAGTLVVANGAALSDASAVSLASSTTLDVASSETIGSLAGSGTVQLNAQRLTTGTNGASTAFSGMVIGTGGVSKTGAGTFTLSGSDTYSGSTNVDGGVLRITTPAALNSAGAVNVAAGGTLDLQSALTIGSLAGTGSVTLNANPLTTGGNGASTDYAGALSGSGDLTKAGSGNFTLSGANSFTGATLLNGGTLTLSGGNALSDTTAVTQAGGTTLALQNSETIGSLAGAGQVNLNANTLTAGGTGADTVYAGVIGGAGGLTKQGGGTMTLTGANSYAGPTQIAAGALQIGNGAASGRLGTGNVVDNASLIFQRTDAVAIDNAISGSGSVTVAQGAVTLNNPSNSYTGTTRVAGGQLLTGGAERLPDASAVTVDAGAQLTLAGDETVASINAAGSVVAQGNVTTLGDQTYGGSLTLSNPGNTHLTADNLTALNAANRLGSNPLSITANTANLLTTQNLSLDAVDLSQGGQITANKLVLTDALNLTGGTLGLTATATPANAAATVVANAQVPGTGKPLALAEATIAQQDGSLINVAAGAALNVAATGGGSVTLGQLGNSFLGSLSVLSGPQFNTAWVPNVRGKVGIQSQADIAGGTVNIGGAGVEADIIQIEADRLSTAGDAVLAARLPYDDVALGTARSTPSMLLSLAPDAFQQSFPFGASGDQGIRVAVGSRSIGGRTTGLSAGFLTVRPKNGAQGSTAVFLMGPDVSAQVGGYRFFNDGAGIQTEIPVFYNGVLPLTPQVSGALSSVAAVAEEARRARFEETVRTENVAVRLRSGVIAEVGPGRAATVGTEGARPPDSCDQDTAKPLSCVPTK